VYDNFLRDGKQKQKKNAQPIIMLRKWLTACHRKNVEVYNKNR